MPTGNDEASLSGVLGFAERNRRIVKGFKNHCRQLRKQKGFLKAATMGECEMARRAGNRKRSRRAVRYVTDGNAVRKLAPEKRSQQDERRALRQRAEYDRHMEELERQQNARMERLRQKYVTVDRPFLLFLAVCMIATLYICFNYIQVQTDINTRISSIESKKRQFDRLKSENDALQNSIDTSVDLNEIYRVATQELGMVYAGKDQVITYDKTESEYVRQYEDIPQYKK